jgi:hypothetical protein
MLHALLALALQTPSAVSTDAFVREAIPPRPTTSALFIDEIEDDDAWVLIDADDHRYKLPVDMLPLGTAEGQTLWITISRRGRT